MNKYLIALPCSMGQKGFCQAYYQHYVNYGLEHMSMARTFLSMLNDVDAMRQYGKIIRTAVKAHILIENSNQNRDRDLNTFIFTEFFFRTEAGHRLGIGNDPKYLVLDEEETPTIRREFMERNN
tara:strand:+ start:711 stop:1082 length:372 start_codon:yes stop_codon:yes gene_type:complete